MPYIGYSPTNAGTFIEIDDFSSTFNGAGDGGTDVVAFTLQVGGVDITPNTANVLVMLDGILQQPPAAYSISGSTLTFTEAPASGTDLYAVLIGQSASVGQGTITASELAIAGNGSSGQVLTSDGDGTFTWATDSEPYLPLAGGTMSGAINLGSQNVTNGGTITGTFVGGITGNVTGNASGTALTVTQAAQTQITSVGTLTSLTSSGIIKASSGSVSGSASAPTLAFGDGDTGFFESSDDSFKLTIGGTKYWNFMAGYISGDASGAPYIVAGAGSASAPVYAFNDDPNTGMYRTGADSLGFSTNGTQRLEINSSGNATFAGKVITSASTDSVAEFSTSHATGAYLSTQNSGSSFGYFGSAKALISGSNANNDLAIRAENTLFLVAGGSGEDVKIEGNGNTTFAGSATATALHAKNITSSGVAGVEVGTGSGDLKLTTYGSSYSTNGAFRQDGAVVDADDNLSGGLSIISRHASSGEIRFYTDGYADGNKRLTIGNDGASTFTGTVTTPGVQRTMVIDPKLYSKDNVYGTDDTRVTITNDQQTIPLLPGYTITSVLIPTATNRTSFSWDWELCKHDEYSTETVVSSGSTGNQSGNPWVTMDVTDYTIENEQRVYFRISNVATSGGTYGYMYNWRVSYTSPTTM